MNELNPVSMRTGQTFLTALSEAGYAPRDIVITPKGEWIERGYSRYPETLLAHADVVCPALHGTYGEDGKLQRFLDRHGMRYTGTRPFSSHIAMHKALAKDYLRDTGIPLAPHILVSQDSLANLHGMCETIEEYVTGPSFLIKPVTSGNSHGVRIAENTAMLPGALRQALAVHPEVLVERHLSGKEATVGVIRGFRGSQLYTLPPVEISYAENAAFYTDVCKNECRTPLTCPGRFSKTEKEVLEHYARTVHEQLDLGQYSRSDFIVTGDGVYFLETNTMPQIGDGTPFSTGLESVGSSTGDFIQHILTSDTARV